MKQTDQEALKQDLPLFKELSKNLSFLQGTYENCYDVTFRTFFIGDHTEAVLLYMEGLSDTKQLENNVMDTLMEEDSSFSNIHKAVKEKLHVLDTKEIHTFADCVTYVSTGLCLGTWPCENRKAFKRGTCRRKSGSWSPRRVHRRDTNQHLPHPEKNQFPYP